MVKKSKPVSKAKARAGEQPALPGLEPSPAWQKMKSAPKKGKREKVHRVDAGPGHPSWRNQVVPGKCTCGDQLFEAPINKAVIVGEGGKLVPVPNDDPTPVKMNPWTFGHAYWCSMFMPKCDDCGRTSGTHTPECSFWKLHPNLTPF